MSRIYDTTGYPKPDPIHQQPLYRQARGVPLLAQAVIVVVVLVGGLFLFWYVTGGAR